MPSAMHPMPSSIRILNPDNRSCAIKDTTAFVACWGATSANPDGQTDVPADLQGAYAITAGGRHTCVLTEGPEANSTPIRCWGDNNNGQISVPTGLIGVRTLTAGWEHTCALTSGARVAEEFPVACWGRDFNMQARVPLGLNRDVAVSAGWFHTCAAQRSCSSHGTLPRLNGLDAGTPPPPPTPSFLHFRCPTLTAGRGFICERAEVSVPIRSLYTFPIAAMCGVLCAGCWVWGVTSSGWLMWRCLFTLSPPTMHPSPTVQDYRRCAAANKASSGRSANQSRVAGLAAVRTARSVIGFGTPATRTFTTRAPACAIRGSTARVASIPTLRRATVSAR